MKTGSGAVHVSCLVSAVLVAGRPAGRGGASRWVDLPIFPFAAPGLGRGGRRRESKQPDQNHRTMKTLEVLNAHAAGLDLGSEKIHASVAGESPRVFGTFTADVLALRDWLRGAGVKTVAVEATGIYWLTV